MAMDRSEGTARTVGSDARSQRLRAAWLYFAHGLTQREVAARLGVSRSTVIRLLDDARARLEVRIWIEADEARCVGLGARLEHHFGLARAIVVPGAGTPGDAVATARAVGLALGRHLSGLVRPEMRIGVGWGRTLEASLESFRPPRCPGARVLALLGGTLAPVAANPVDHAWRLADALGGDCHLFPAPLIVDSGETRRRLVEACGLSRLFGMADGLDLAVLSVGEAGAGASSLSAGLIDGAAMDALVAAGAVGDVMCWFLDSEGREVDHPLRGRVMAVPLATVRGARRRILASGGAHRAAAIRAAIAALAADTLVTDEPAAEALLRLAPLTAGR